MFDIATRKKYRYPSSKGMISTEQLWDLPLTSNSGFSLDDVAKAINRELKTQEEESFVDTSSNPRKTELSNMLAIVVAIIQTKQAENAAARQAAQRRAEREQLVEILHNKKLQEASNLSTEELERRIAALS